MSCSTIAIHADDILVGLPAIIPAVLTTGFGFAASHPNPALASLGHIGARIFAVITVVTGLPLVIWNIVKILLANLLNIATFGKCGPCIYLANRINTLSGTVIYAWARIISHPVMDNEEPNLALPR